MGSLIQSHPESDFSSNPFSTRFIRPGAVEYIFPPAMSVAHLMQEFERNRRVSQILGCHGSGKSTLLHSLRPELEQLAIVRWVNVRPRVDRQWWNWIFRSISGTPEPAAEGQPNPREIWVIDGFDRLDLWSRRRLVRDSQRKKSGLLVTTHRDLGLATLYRPSLNEPTFLRLATGLLAATGSRMSAGEIRAAFALHAPNVREALFALYDRHEDVRRTWQRPH